MTVKIRTTFEQRQELRRQALRRGCDWITMVELDFKGQVQLEQYNTGYVIEFNRAQDAVMFMLKY